MTIIEQIEKSDVGLDVKIVQLFAVVMTNYRQPLGDAAWDKMREISGVEQTNALAYLTGFMLADSGPSKPHRWAELLPEAKR